MLIRPPPSVAVTDAAACCAAIEVVDDVGVWQAALRDRSEPIHASLVAAVGRHWYLDAVAPR
jgi:hypothetical protein